MPVPERKPNIILIVTEQQRGDCLSIEGHPVLMTPHMDWIAGEGVRFTRAYASCPSCIAARRSLLSGQYPATHGMVGYRDNVEWRQAPPTLPGVLSDAGYHTYHAGRSMHQSPPRKRYGFDHMALLEDYFEWLDARAPEAGGWRGSGIMNNDYTAHPWPLAEHLHHTNWTVERALEFLRRRDPSCPFFLNVSFLAAHPPLQPPRAYFERYLRTGVPPPHIGAWAQPPPHKGLGLEVGGFAACLEGEKLLSARAGYYGLINHLDDQIRRLLYPSVSGVDFNNTIVMLVSDHGEMLGDHYHWHKIFPYEGAARIPFLLRAPRSFGIKPGTVRDAAVSLEDVMPTLLDMAGVALPATVEGRSLLGLMRGEPPPARQPLHIEHAPYYHCLTDGKRKYIWFVKDGGEQLFDLDADPHELHDLAREQAWAAELTRWRTRMAETLKGRPEGFTDGGKLISGRDYPAVLPQALSLP